jgi:hypothetical protein
VILNFSVQKRAERIGRNPKAGDPINIPEKVVTFKQGKALGEKFLVKAKPKGKIKKQNKSLWTMPEILLFLNIDKAL